MEPSGDRQPTFGELIATARELRERADALYTRAQTSIADAQCTREQARAAVIGWLSGHRTDR